MEPVANKRKLIDLRPEVFRGLSLKARKRGVTLKRYIENVLEEDAADAETPIPSGVTSPKVISLIGLAKGADMDWEEERLNYLLSK